MRQIWYNEKMNTIDIRLNDTVQMKKPHPCGCDRFVIARTGADIKLKCAGCGHVIMLDRVLFEKKVKKIIIKE